jgi:hypothetical protein
MFMINYGKYLISVVFLSGASFFSFGSSNTPGEPDRGTTIEWLNKTLEANEAFDDCNAAIQKKLYKERREAYEAIIRCLRSDRPYQGCFSKFYESGNQYTMQEDEARQTCLDTLKAIEAFLKVTGDSLTKDLR